jgi:hypothetical protein
VARMTRFKLGSNWRAVPTCTPSGSSGLGFGVVLLRASCFGLCDDPPREDHKQRAEEGGDEIRFGMSRLGQTAFASRLDFALLELVDRYR